MGDNGLLGRIRLLLTLLTVWTVCELFDRLPVTVGELGLLGRGRLLLGLLLTLNVIFGGLPEVGKSGLLGRLLRMLLAMLLTLTLYVLPVRMGEL